jgi:hypothetical protein
MLAPQPNQKEVLHAEVATRVRMGKRVVEGGELGWGVGVGGGACDHTHHVRAPEARVVGGHAHEVQGAWHQGPDVHLNDGTTRRGDVGDDKAAGLGGRG